ncbi:MAG: GNAT family N-acetyltransferase [Actinobacteria bacterium]|jgi:mycothiol synthase|nr:GNAT family N-acetyltransferase [Actinomycetota bacterium]
MPIAVTPLPPEHAANALAVVEADEAVRGASVIDEAELERLRRYARSGERTAAWTPLVARSDAEDVGYAGLLLGDDGVASGDAAATLDAQDPAAVLEALLRSLSDAARDGGASHLQVWVRQVGEVEHAAAERAGFAVDRRLGVLGRALPGDLEVVPPAAGWTIRPSQVPSDDEGVVEVLASAYADTDDAGWTVAQLRQRQAYDWYRAEDLLVAEGPAGRIGGLHWLKRRTPRQGEVYNLAIAPHAQGAGLGAALLSAGLLHLREVGCTEVVLWVDRANERAVRLYERNGFTTRWYDVAFGIDLK